MSGQKLGRAVVAGVRLGDEVGDLAVGSLLGGEVAQPLHREAADVVEERSGLDEDLPVAGPPGALAGRAVGRDVARVAAEAPLGDPMERVDPLVGALRSRRPRSRSVCTTTAVTSSTVRPSQVAVDPHVLEALGAVAWLEDVTVDAGRDDHVDLERQRPCRSGSTGRRRAPG